MYKIKSAYYSWEWSILSVQTINTTTNKPMRFDIMGCFSTVNDREDAPKLKEVPVDQIPGFFENLEEYENWKITNNIVE